MTAAPRNRSQHLSPRQSRDAILEEADNSGESLEGAMAAFVISLAAVTNGESKFGKEGII